MAGRDYRGARVMAGGRLGAEWTLSRSSAELPVPGSIADEIVGEARADMDYFLQNLVQAGQDAHRAVAEARRRVAEGYYANHYPLTDQELLAAVRRHVELRSPWGKDAMSPLLARLLALGDFVH